MSRKTYQRIPATITLTLAGSAIALAGIAPAVGAASGTLAGGHSASFSKPAGKTGAIRLPGPASRVGVITAGAARLAVATTAAAGQMQAADLAARRAWPDRTPRQIARTMLHHRFHWKRWQFKYLNRLWNNESGWNRFASNPYSGAYGIPQAVPGNKMAAAGPDWQWSARTQIRWGMRYIQERYRTPYWAWRHEVNDGWY